MSLFILEYGYFNKNGRRAFDALCHCGKIITTGKPDIKKEPTRTCGCLRIEVMKSMLKKHGFCFDGEITPEYRAWCSMKTRCFNKNRSEWMRYGGRGITVCKRWKESFKNFFYDMGTRPSEKHSLDRIDTDGNYEPSNCRWATQSEQASNKKKLSIYKNKPVTSKYRGVSFNRNSKKWSSCIVLNKKRFYLGKFENEMDAYAAIKKCISDSGVKVCL